MSSQTQRGPRAGEGPGASLCLQDIPEHAGRVLAWIDHHVRLSLTALALVTIGYGAAVVWALSWSPPRVTGYSPTTPATITDVPITDDPWGVHGPPHVTRPSLPPHVNGDPPTSP